MELPSGSIAVIFVSKKSGADAEGYARMDDEMVEAVKSSAGYLGHDSVGGNDGQGITISYWRDLESVDAWRRHQRHVVAQTEGRRSWYDQYRLIVTRVERAHDWVRPV